MRYLCVKCWKEFQHYKDRDPPWIKLYKNLFTTEAWLTGTDLSRLVQVASTLLAARYSNKTPYVWEVVRKVTNLDCTEQAFHDAVGHLIRSNFLEIQQDEDGASNVLATCATTPKVLYSETEAETEAEKREREARSRGSLQPASKTLAPSSVPHGTLIPAGNKLTGMSVDDAFASLLEDWRRDVPEANADAFAKWIVHVESSGKQMTSGMRLAQARRLAGNGDFAAQAEVVLFCTENGFKTLIPIGDVRARTQGMRRDAKGKPAAQTDAEALQKLKNRREAIGLADFRDPQPGESADAYGKAQDAEHKRLDQQRNGAPRFARDLAATKRIPA